MMAWIHKGNHKPVWRCLVVALASVAWCRAADSTLHVRLLTPLSSHSSEDGTDFDTVVTSDWPSAGPVAIPAGSHVRGKVIRARPVGLGLRREHALLELGFSEYVLPDGTRHPMWASLRGVDNAREDVRKGRIRGVDAASGPGGWVQGLWLRPSAALVPNSLAGIVGLSGTLGSKMPLGPAGDIGLLLARILLFRLPETEIQLPAGADFQIAVTRLPSAHPEFEAPPDAQLTAEQRHWLARRPALVTEPTGKPVRDRINIAFTGTVDEVISALRGAGWSQADSLSRDSFGRVYRAFTSMSGYRTAPVSPIYYGDWLPDLVFEKSFNSIAKRHHLRLWRTSPLNGRDMWVGAASHDVRMAVKKWPVSFTHEIDPRIDLERERVIEDLRFAGCAEASAYVERPELAAEKPGKGPQTDGRLVFVPIHGCRKPEVALDAANTPERQAGPIALRMARRLVLEARYHLTRGNVYYKGLLMLRGRQVILPGED